MRVHIHADAGELGRAAAAEAADVISAAIARHGEALVVFATGASQFATLEALVAADIDWSRVSGVHLDEYVGISPEHRASFRRYLRERVVARLPTLGHFAMIAGNAPDLSAEIARLNTLLTGRRVDLCLAGIGENGHLAFNDPPADFEAEAPYLVVDLDAACRQQQVNEGWFPDLGSVPAQAVSMSIRQIMRAERLVLSVGDRRKAEAVRNTIEGPVSPACPASIIQGHKAASVHLDTASASLLAGR
ncbi:glucosamine-6-phosphate deaminase [Devosia enhydra]|uniref:Glucosamine-6-phosphate deaminase n=1 Tax=Devosia enhydra TaxID=665118 RepID=A0A1K2HZM3_9HYPH|nr:glucosamine-6-phosphate deaminase [Devosia enhydra]SFZ85578.1 glucosamine-6-phosphate deaminase [Devosia enhydra]